MTGPNGGSPDAVREFNRARVVAALRAGGATSRTELCAITGLSRSTVTAFVLDLLQTGVIVETSDADPAARQPGRPTRRLQLAPRTDLVLAVDLGHSHCTVGIVDPTGTILAEDTAALDVDSSPEAALDHTRRVIDALVGGIDRDRVSAGALGLPAPVDVRSGSIGPGNVLPRWIDRRPAHELSDAIGIPFTVDNDANLGALAESTYGAAREVGDLIYVKASTGIGAGLILGGRIHHGSQGRAGEIGHVPVDPSGPVCRCGNRGCLETVASVAQVLHAMRPRHGDGLTLERVVELVDSGDAGALRVIGDAGRLIGRVLADVVNSLNPEMVVVGGELAQAGVPLLTGVRESVERYAQPGIARDLRIELGLLGAHSELLGAAALALRHTAAVRT
ncbi:MAG: ROK family protein [Jatrophihabitantaceae bacterium]